MKLTFTIPGPPRGKERPRFNPLTGGVYTPGRTRKYEREVHMACLVAVRTLGDWPTDATYRVELDLYHAKKQWPDVDNVLKAVLDGCNGAAWLDDRQVTHAAVSRNTDKQRPRVDVVVEVV